MLTGEPPAQAVLVLRLVESEVCLVSDLVVVESYFALHVHYGVPKREALSVLLGFLESERVPPTGQAVILREAPSKPGFLERLIHAEYAPVRLATFEKASGRLDGARLIN